MALQVKREGATPNLLKYSIVADSEGGEVSLSHEALMDACVRGPLRTYIERARNLKDSEAACRYLLCNPSMRVFVTPRSFARTAVDAGIEGSVPTLKIMAEPDAIAIIALEFRHTLAA